MANNIISIKEMEINGQKVSVKKYKPKKKKGNNARSNTFLCPNCLSTMTVNKFGWHVCNGDKLKVWEKEFVSFSKLDENEKQEYFKNLSDYGRFIDLYDKWAYSKEVNDPNEFNCGYTHDIFPLFSIQQIKIPDPLYVNWLEEKLGRKLTEKELIGESELYQVKSRIYTKARKKARLVEIPYIILPSEITVFEKD